MTSKEYNKIFIVVGGWISTVISLFYLPVVFGISGIILGILLFSKNEKKHGVIMIIFAILFATIGVFLGDILN